MPGFALIFLSAAKSQEARGLWKFQHDARWHRKMHFHTLQAYWGLRFAGLLPVFLAPGALSTMHSLHAAIPVCDGSLGITRLRSSPFVRFLGSPPLPQGTGPGSAW